MSSYCFLFYSPSDKGTFLAQWSKEKNLDGAMIMFETKKTIPSYKFTSHSGRSTIITDIHSIKTKYFQGICQFIKMAKQFDAPIIILESCNEQPIKFDLHILNKDNSVVMVTMGTEFALDNSVAAAVLPKNCSELSVKTLTKDQFISKGNNLGGSISF
ncbi:hypothetical protein BmR1_04g09850 [Babesia microti strain RI]|uniref:Uncharacterized protein n=1 Tax=Babesia microti (strain RI) TaxID=1133968 RepID=I7IHN8_BABMR|nr:hypothetical protein BmR1_04g09850 [Babesia microti strain RI]CCF76137.1 hypothetical protein BmR1_04g09850 [Babesia microti strain RI]|eukprot:XP_012650545.1 hypothetical protein BmR1_04g09850 [Babesia microti strain RI]